MLPTLAYYACLFAIAPTASLALAFWGVSRVANSGGWRGIGRLLLQLLELAGSPTKLILIVVVLVAIVLAGGFRTTRPAGYLVLGLLGLVSVIQILALDRSLNAWLLMSLPTIAAGVCFWCAWTFFSPAFLTSPAVVPGV